VYVSNSDHGVFLPMYLQVVEGRRPDVLITSSRPIYEPWTRDPALTPLIDELIDTWEAGEAITPEQRNVEALRFAVRLGPAIGWSRPVYCFAYVPHAPIKIPAVGLWTDLFRIVPEEPDLLAPDPGGMPTAEFPGGISLARAAVEPQVVSPRDLFSVTLYWRCAAPIARPPPVLVGLGHRDESGALLRPSGMLTGYGTWFAQGRGPLPPTPPGSVYRQQVTCIAPTGAPPGRWEVHVGIGADLDAAVRLSPAAAFTVAAAR
jgi:hypothetical protein